MTDFAPMIALTLGVLLIVLGLKSVLRGLLRPKARPDRRPRRPSPGATVAAPPAVEINPRSILIDGSNVMHWADNTPRIETLQRVLARLRSAGNDPILCFDANIGYKLVGQHMDPDELARFFGVAERNILIAPSGTDADAMILRIAVDKALPVVSNDQYRDYPDLAARISTMTGRIDGTKVDLRLRDRSRARQ